MPATALGVLAVLKGEITGPEADATLASYFPPARNLGSIRRRPGPKPNRIRMPRYDRA